MLKLIVDVNNQSEKIPENSRFHTVAGTLIALIEFSDGSNLDKKSLKQAIKQEKLTFQDVLGLISKKKVKDMLDKFV